MSLPTPIQPGMVVRFKLGGPEMLVIGQDPLFEAYVLCAISTTQGPQERYVRKSILTIVDTTPSQFSLGPSDELAALCQYCFYLGMRHNPSPSVGALISNRSPSRNPRPSVS